MMTMQQGQGQEPEVGAAGAGLPIDMRGKRVFVAGVADSRGYGWAIAKACAEAGATILLGTWPPVMNLFQTTLNRGVLDRVLSNGKKMEIAKVSVIESDGTSLLIRKVVSEDLSFGCDFRQ